MSLRNTPTHNSWLNMKARCNNPCKSKWDSYGGRGITYCSRWEYFEYFLADMGERPKNTTLDRVDNDGDYTPENCKWATREEQMNNRRNNLLLTYDGRKQTIAQWAREVGINYHVLYNRVMTYGWTDEEALTIPVRARR